jgi:hypothetical protein
MVAVLAGRGERATVTPLRPDDFSTCVRVYVQGVAGSQRCRSAAANSPGRAQCHAARDWKDPRDMGGTSGGTRTGPGGTQAWFTRGCAGATRSPGAPSYGNKGVDGAGTAGANWPVALFVREREIWE